MIRHVCADCGATFHMTETFMGHDCDRLQQRPAEYVTIDEEEDQ